MAEIRWININIGCIETIKTQQLYIARGKININIGCIETLINFNSAELVDMININIGCIETVTTERILELCLKDKY